ncbi:hypothetical protein [Bdellovibrio bacteriovorus]|uniref:hypothetical protein n=1 Tax=Bdellovibrio bacteriovorus TaxID=959 RepID=UPI0035A71D0C
MRWSKSLMTLGLVAVSVNLAACKKQSNNSVRTAKIAKTAAPLTEKQKAERAAMTSEQLCYQDLCASQSTEISYANLMAKAAQPSDTQKSILPRTSGSPPQGRGQCQGATAHHHPESTAGKRV